MFRIAPGAFISRNTVAWFLYNKSPWTVIDLTGTDYIMCQRRMRNHLVCTLLKILYVHYM